MVMSQPASSSGVGGEVGSATAYGHPPTPTMPAIEDGSANPMEDVMAENVGADTKLTREGQPAKKPGPKPDSKPPKTRKSELNRLAQRYVNI